jgi:hypothetical protein
VLPELERVGEALPLWTYASEELLELEYQEFFLKGWQMGDTVTSGGRGNRTRVPTNKIR